MTGPAVSLTAPLGRLRPDGTSNRTRDVTHLIPNIDTLHWSPKRTAAPEATGPRLILAEVAARHGVLISAIKGRSRLRRIVRVRNEAMYRLYAGTDRSLGWIGQWFDGRDHATILHGIRRHAARHGLPVALAVKQANGLDKNPVFLAMVRIDR